MESSAVGQGVSFPLRFIRSFLTCFWFKAIGTTAFTTVFFVAYIHLLKNPSGPVTEVPLTWFDAAIGFQPAALIPYLSLWLYVSLPPTFLLTRTELVKYGLHIGLMCITGLLIFWLWPTAVPPANIDWARYPGMAFLKGIDAAGNACPSLHVATALFSAIWLEHLLRRFAAPRGLRWFSALWCLAIIWSTVATRQHVVLDAVAGTALALLFAGLSFRFVRVLPRSSAKTEILEKKRAIASTRC
ncbi:phosphatase PAP2 family protein [Uliginosibacterium paludis]|uniref:Phosphatase PAP2 family protein n=1 Tax=Uliginosibacterium paludis TaxID=1615952 RepID=A0ABV2CVB0_9RHOO